MKQNRDINNLLQVRTKVGQTGGISVHVRINVVLVPRRDTVLARAVLDPVQAAPILTRLIALSVTVTIKHRRYYVKDPK